jgi:hypothetical protein
MRWNYPLDPNCPEVIALDGVLDDPMTVASGVGDEIMEDFERKHRSKCKRCQEFGAANVEVV